MLFSWTSLVGVVFLVCNKDTITRNIPFLLKRLSPWLKKLQLCREVTALKTPQIYIFFVLPLIAEMDGRPGACCAFKGMDIVMCCQWSFPHDFLFQYLNNMSEVRGRERLDHSFLKPVGVFLFMTHHKSTTGASVILTRNRSIRRTLLIPLEKLPFGLQ